MSFLRILGFATLTTVLAMLSIAPSFIPAPSYILLIFSTLVGFALAQFFAHADMEEKLGVTSIVFNSFSAITIVLGTITNIINSTINELQQVSIAPIRHLPIELAMLAIGLFAPMIAINTLEREKTPIAPILWNVLVCATLYLIVLTLQKIAQTTTVQLT